MNKRVILLAPAPLLTTPNPMKYVRHALRRGLTPINTAPISCTRESMRERNKEMYPMLRKMEEDGLCAIVDPSEGLPEEGAFEIYRNGVFLMKDDNHLTPEGSVYLFERLRPQLEPLLRNTPAATPPVAGTPTPGN